MKSLFSSIFKLVIHGLYIKTFGFPPKVASLALASPKALATYILNNKYIFRYLLTANLPGRIRKGIVNPRSDSFKPIPYCAIFVLNILPPALYILSFSILSLGL